MKINMAGQGSDKDKGDVTEKRSKGKGKEDAKGTRWADEDRNKRTVFVGGLRFDTDESTLKKDFGECGEIEALRIPKDEEGKPKGMAFIEYKTQEGVYFDNIIIIL